VVCEYFDITHINGRYYYDILDRSLCRTRLRFELLDHFENTLDCIEQDIESENAGSIVSNNEQGCRKSCSFTLINVDSKYTIDENHFFWFNRKFKIYLGITDGTHTFWFSKGVFITRDANCDSVAHTVAISGVDKYAQLDGTLKTMQLDEMNTVFEQGVKVENAIRDILMLDLGNGFVLDPIEPMIDPEIASATLYRTFTASAGEYFGAFMEEVMACFGCNIFYDNNGRLTVRKIFNEDIPYWYAFKAPTHVFNYEAKGYIAPSLSMEMNGVNKIIAQNETTEEKIYTYTAINHNPRSPLCYDKIGARTLNENGGIVYIPTGGADNDWYYDEWKHHVRYYAEYRLLKETCMALSVKFNAPPYYHLNEDDVVYITDKDFGLDNDLFIIQSITYPMGGGEISIEAVNAKFLNVDIFNDALATEIRPVYYDIVYDLNGGDGWISAIRLTSSDTRFQAATGYLTDKHSDEFYREDYEFVYWIDAENNKYYPLEYYPNPYDFLRLQAVWVDVSKRKLIIKMQNLDNKRFNIPACDVGIYGSKDYCVSEEFFFTVDGVEHDEKYYPNGRGTYGNHSAMYSQAISGDLTTVIRIAGTDFSLTEIKYFLSNTTFMPYMKSIHLPDYMSEFNFMDIYYNTANTCEEIIFPSDMELLTSQNSGATYSSPPFAGLANLKEINFNNDKPLTIQMTASSSSGNVSFNAGLSALEKVIFNNDVTFECTVGKLLAFSNNVTNYDIIIHGNLSLLRTNFFSSFSSSAENENTIDITGIVDTNDSNSSFINSAQSPLTSVIINELKVSNGYVLSGCRLKDIQINTLSQSGSSMGGGLNCENLIVDNLNLTGGMFISGATITNNVKFNNDVVITGGSFMSGGITTPAIEFHGSVSVNGASFICRNSNLTDVYFYSDEVSFGTGAYFQGNNSSFIVHGIADGYVQSFCEARGIAFETITE